MRLLRTLTLLLTSVTAGLAAAIVVLWLKPGLLETAPPSMQLVRESAGPSLRQGPVSYADAVARAAPAVVNIFAAKVTTERQSLSFRDPLLQHLFGDLLPDRTRQRTETSLGSGVIVSPEGYLLTNYHIIQGAAQVRVQLASGRTLEVDLVGVDPDSDLAVLRARGDDLPVIPFGDSAALRVGDVVLTVGNPFGIGQTVTMGIVSATGRDRLGISSYENFIQTDAAINPGNSGGALINARGELVGINTAIFSKTGASHGIGFAIPTDLAEGVMRQIVAGGRVVRGWVGLRGQDVTAELAESFGLATERGVLISGVLEQGPGDRAGMRPGDVVTEVDGRPLHDAGQFRRLIAAAGPGTILRLRGLRGSEPFEVAITTAERPQLANPRPGEN